MKTQFDTSRITYYLVGLTIGTLLILWYSGGISGNDFWWHLKIGEWILDNESVPRVGIYSWYAIQENLPWISHEWLSEVVLFKVYDSMGPLGIIGMSALMALLLLAMMMHLNRDSIQGHPALSTIYLLFSLIIFPVYFYGRPQIFSIFLLFGAVYCLYQFMDGTHRRLIWALPVISLFWSNLHGGSANLPYTLCLLALATGLLRFDSPRLASHLLSKREVLQLVLVAVSSVLATAISPHGFQMIVYPFVNMGDALMLHNIREWASPDAKSLFELLLCFGPILYVSLVLLISTTKIRVLDLVIFLFFAYLAFRSIRFILLFYVVGAFFVFRYLPKSSKKQPMTKRFATFVAGVVFILLAVNILSFVRLMDTLDKGEPIAKVLDDKYIHILLDTKPQRLFNDYNYGELLIYNGIDTFIDGRADIYTKHNLLDSLLISNLNAPKGATIDGPLALDTVIAKYDFDAFLISSERSLAIYLLSHPERYRLLMGDENTMYFITISSDGTME